MWGMDDRELGAKIRSSLRVVLASHASHRRRKCTESEHQRFSRVGDIVYGLSQFRKSRLGTSLEYGAFRAYAGIPRHISRETTHPKALVFGHQKTGTSVVASVVAQQAQVGCSIDLPAERLRPSDPSRVSVETLLRRSAPFSYRTLVKEPHWSLFAPRILEELPDVLAVGVLRDPVENIESICYRLRIPTETLNARPEVGPWWQPMIDGHGLASPSHSALENLAARIALCEERLSKALLEFPDRMRVVNYEDFVVSPVSAARSLVHFFGGGRLLVRPMSSGNTSLA